MAQANGIISGALSGTLNKELVFRQREGKTIVSKYPDMSKVVRTDKQKRVNETMRAANYYAQVITADEEERVKAQIRLDVPRKKLFIALIKEYFEQNSEKSKAEPKKKEKKLSYEAYRAVVFHLLKTGMSPEVVAKTVDSDLPVIMNLKEELEKVKSS